MHFQNISSRIIGLRGHGYSDKPRHIKFNEFADDIILLLDYLYIDQAAFIGHEMGATIMRIYQSNIQSMSFVNNDRSTSIEGVTRRTIV